MGTTIALVPTMGALHEGHLSLVRKAREVADRVVVSIFVNPTQFGRGEDLGTYPRNLADDLGKLGPLADAVFAPADPKVIYPDGFSTYVVPEELSRSLCGASRPGHFRGVCTVVALLFRISRCDVAVFGKKDYQQWRIVERMVRDLWLDVEIIGAETIREPDGLALSSRNTYLSDAERKQALGIRRSLSAMSGAVSDGERDVATLLADARAELEDASGLRVDYLEIVDAQTLEPMRRVSGPAVCAVAAFAGSTRLIDNVELAP